MPRGFKVWHLIFIAVVLIAIWSGATRSTSPTSTTSIPRALGTVPVSSSAPTSTSSSVPPTSSSTTSAPRTSAARGIPVGVPYYDVVPAGCVIRATSPAVLPDPSCTPGATNPAVTKATLGSTICMPGWTSTVRPSSSYTYRLKVRQMSAWGIFGSTRTTEEDHLISLELGGAPSDSRNLWPELGGIPNPKDRLENHLKSLVCAGQLGLGRAQRMIATDWVSAYRQAFGQNP